MSKNLIIVILLSFTFRLVNINQSFWLDEATSGIVVRDINLLEILKVFSPADFHPPLYYLVLKLWSEIFGTGEIALRMLSVIFGVGTVVTSYKIAELYKSKRLPLIVGILMATAPLHIYYSQEARMYSMAAFFVALSAYFLIVLKKKISSRFALCVGLFASLAVLSDYMTIFFIPVIWVSWFLNNKLRREMRLFMIAHLPVIAAIVMLLPLFLQQFINALGVRESGSLWWNILGTFSIKNILLVPIKLIIGRISFDNSVIYGLYAGVAFMLFSYLILSAWREKKKYIELFLWLKMPVVIAIIVSLLIPVLYYFRLLFILPALYLLLGIGMVKMKNWPFILICGLVLMVNILSTALYFSNIRFHREDWRGMVEYINTSGDNSQVVFLNDSQMEAFDYYSDGLVRVSPRNMDLKSDKIWLMRYVHDIYDPNDSVRMKIEDAGFIKKNEHNFNGVVVWQYENSN